MPRSKHPQTYGPEYEVLVLRAFNEGTLHLPMPSEAHARAFRMKLYGYFRALRKDAIRHDLIEKIDTFSLALDGSGILIFPREDTWDSEAIRAGLGLTKDQLPPPAPTAHSALLQKLDEIRARTAKKDS
jgi:hypothetical protein